MARFFIQEALIPGESLVLNPDRSHYICRVLRHRTGDRLLGFDGSGREFECEVRRASTKACELSVLSVARQEEPPKPELHLAVALLKGSAMDRALQQATELGVSHVWLLDAQRGNVHLNSTRMANKLDHFEKILASSAEQCGSLFVPTLHPPVGLVALLTATSFAKPLVLHTEGDAFPKALESTERCIFIGPEGGWDTAELTLFNEKDIPTHSVGGLTFRAETAPAVALALVQQAQGWR
jgi:16S rRNA (uracil1498-N3)-methyltransferase